MTEINFDPERYRVVTELKKYEYDYTLYSEMAALYYLSTGEIDFMYMAMRGKSAFYSNKKRVRKIIRDVRKKAI